MSWAFRSPVPDFLHLRISILINPILNLNRFFSYSFKFCWIDFVVALFTTVRFRLRVSVQSDHESNNPAEENDVHWNILGAFCCALDIFFSQADQFSQRNKISKSIACCCSGAVDEVNLRNNRCQIARALEWIPVKQNNRSKLLEIPWKEQ